MTTYAHFALSFPAASSESNPLGWARDFGGDWAALGRKIRQVCDALGTQSILLRGYDGCRLPRWVVGEKKGSGGFITSGVLTTGNLHPDVIAARRPVVKGLIDDGFEILVHTGAATTLRDAIRSAVTLWQDGITRAAIDSSGNNVAVPCRTHLDCLEALDVRVYTEPTGSVGVAGMGGGGGGGRPALANVRFIDAEIDAGRPVDRHIAWLNDPTEEQRAHPEAALARAVAAGAGTAVPWPLLETMQG